jgi:hypothetical protein
MRRSWGVAAVLLLVACSSGGRSRSPSAQPAGEVLGVPLFPGSAVVASSRWNARSGPDAVPAGREVIVQSAASFGELAAWVDGLRVHPPHGMRVANDGNSAPSETRRFGVAAATFDRIDRTGAEGQRVVVVVIDPERMEATLRPLFAALKTYESLPSWMRAPIDTEVRTKTGFTPEQALRPDAPLGAALAAFRRLHDGGRRGIVVLALGAR